MTNLQSDLPENHFRVPISYTLKTKSELKREFDWVSDWYDRRPRKRHRSCRGIDTTDGERVLFLAEVPEEFIGMMNDRDKLALHFDRLGYRFAIEEEVVAFAKAHPDLQREKYILALGSSVLHVGSYFVVMICGGSSARGLGRILLSRGLDEDGRLLLVRK